MGEVSKNIKLAEDFLKYCKEHPELRFWQALRAWSGFAFILKADIKGKFDRLDEGDPWKDPVDTYYFERKAK